MKSLPKVCRHLHLPVQSGSTRILRAMRRRHTREEYLDLVDRIREAIPDIALSTDMIVGFPGETEQEFGELEQFVSDTQFDHVGVFTYSHEEGTRAHALHDNVSAGEKRRRRNALMARWLARMKRDYAAQIEYGHDFRS